MPAEQFANSASTTLNGAVASGDSTITVNSVTGFPTTPQFRIKVDSEVMLVTGISGSVFTVTRAVEAVGGVQTAVSHSSGASVFHDLTALSVFQAMPSGTVLDFAGFTAPTGFFFTDGSTKSRTTELSLFTALTFTKSLPLVSTQTIAVADTTGLFPGMAVSGTGIPATISFTANIASGGNSLTSVSSISGLTQGMALYGPGLPSTGVHIFGTPSGSTVNLATWDPTITNSSPATQMTYNENRYNSTVTTSGTYYATPAVKTINANTSINLSNNATVTSTQTLTFYPYGAADGSTLFCLPDLRGHVTLGAGSSLDNPYPGFTSWYTRNFTPGMANHAGVQNSADALSPASAGVSESSSDVQVLTTGTTLNLGTFPTYSPFTALNKIIKA